VITYVAFFFITHQFETAERSSLPTDRKAVSVSGAILPVSNTNNNNGANNLTLITWQQWVLSPPMSIHFELLVETPLQKHSIPRHRYFDKNVGWNVNRTDSPPSRMSYAFAVIPVKINTNGSLSNPLYFTTHRLLRQSVAGHSMRRLGFDSSPLRVRFMAEIVTLWLTVTLEQGFLRILRFYHDSAVAPVLRTYRRCGISN